MDQNNDRLFSVISSNPSDLGEATAVVEISSVLWADYIDPIEVEFQVTVLPCEVLELVETDDSPQFSALFPVFELPYSEVVELTHFEPSPLCGATSSDVKYTISEASPEWATFSELERKVEIEAADLSLYGRTETFMFEASYQTVSTEVSFAVAFIAPAKELEVAADESTEEEPTIIEEPVEEEKTEETAAPVSGWDGWLALLDMSKYLPAGVTLPPPNPDPNYIPTPPKPTL